MPGHLQQDANSRHISSNADDVTARIRQFFQLLPLPRRRASLPIGVIFIARNTLGRYAGKGDCCQGDELDWLS